MVEPSAFVEQEQESDRFPCPVLQKEVTLHVTFTSFSQNVEKQEVPPTSGMHIPTAPLILAQLFHRAVCGVERQEFGRVRATEGLAELQKRRAQV